MRARRCFLGLSAWNAVTSLVLVAFAAPSATGQVVRGTLIDEDTDRPVSDARITLLSLDSIPVRSVLTDESGAFVVPADRAGRHRLRADRIGYQTTTSQEFAVPVGDTVVVQFYVSTEAVSLDPLVVQVGVTPGRELFARRSASNRGVFFGPAEVDSLRPETHPAEILSHADAIRVRWGWGYHENGGNGPIPDVSSYFGTEGCLYYAVDHSLVPRPWFLGAKQWGVSPLADLTPEDIVAVEVYRHFFELPADVRSELVIENGQQWAVLKALNRGTCGLVIFWTEDGW